MLLEADGPDLVVRAENMDVLPQLPRGAFSMIYVDPPFNTGRAQVRRTLTTAPARDGQAADRTGFKGRGYASVLQRLTRYDDAFEDYWGFLLPRLEQAWELLAPDGTLYLHLDYREVHYAKVMCDMVFGRECFLNEIIWAYDYGAKARRRWPTKHDNILVYVKDPKAYHFDAAEVDREPYMAPGLVTPEKARRGKMPTDVWWHTIVSPTGKEKTGYPTQKPVGLVRRMVAASSRPGDWVLDFFAGSGTLGTAAASLGRRYVCIDSSEEAVRVMTERLPAARVLDQPIPPDSARDHDSAS